MFNADEVDDHYDTHHYIPDTVQETLYLVWISEAEKSDNVRMKGTLIDIRPDPETHCHYLLGPFRPSLRHWQQLAEGKIDQAQFDQTYIEQLRRSYKENPISWRFLLFQPTLQINAPRPNPELNYTPAMTLAESWLRIHHRFSRQAKYQGRVSED